MRRYLSSIEQLGELLEEHQAHVAIDYLADHGWQVALGNPGGHLWVHACEGDQKWPGRGEGPSLAETILKAVGTAESEGWW